MKHLEEKLLPYTKRFEENLGDAYEIQRIGLERLNFMCKYYTSHNFDNDTHADLKRSMRTEITITAEASSAIENVFSGSSNTGK